MTLSTQPEHSTHPQAYDNIAYLEQGLALLDQIEDEHYAATLPPVFVSGVGAHIRHILDHFDCLLDGLPSGRVDYDRRRRDPRVENERLFAIESIRTLIDRLLALPAGAGEVALTVRMDSGSDAPVWATSSLTRELQFLTSHTIHHYALVAAILGHAGCTVSRRFGISPSTLRHQRQ
jgi:hypothetical protein